ncbi:hypothetical protein EG327_005101, partial [Venturia inaequalis]
MARYHATNAQLTAMKARNQYQAPWNVWARANGHATSSGPNTGIMEGFHLNLDPSMVHEVHVLVELQRRWPGLQNDINSTTRIANYFSQWGPTACPLQADGSEHQVGTEEWKLRHFWRQGTAQFPKCHYCWSGNKPMPRGEDIPLGLDQNIHYMPCVCLYHHAVIESWMIGMRYWKARLGPVLVAGAMPTANQRIATFSRE